MPQYTVHIRAEVYGSVTARSGRAALDQTILALWSLAGIIIDHVDILEEQATREDADSETHPHGQTPP
jgi:hypothetical protein